MNIHIYDLRVEILGILALLEVPIKRIFMKNLWPSLLEEKSIVSPHILCYLGLGSTQNLLYLSLYFPGAHGVPWMNSCVNCLMVPYWLEGLFHFPSFFLFSMCWLILPLRFLPLREPMNKTSRYCSLWVILVRSLIVAKRECHYCFRLSGIINDCICPL